MHIYRGSETTEDIYADDFGVSASNTAAQNATGMLAAIKQAISTKKTLVMPIGDIKCAQVSGTDATDNSSTFALGDNKLHIHIPTGCNILRQNGSWWLYIDTSDQCVKYSVSAAAFSMGTSTGQAGGNQSNLYLYQKFLALTVSDVSAISKYDRISLVTVPSSGYLVTNDDGDSYGYPVEDLHVYDVNTTQNKLFVSLPAYKTVDQYNTRFYHWPHNDACVKITGGGELTLDPATGNPESDSLTNAREFFYILGPRFDVDGDLLSTRDTDRGFAHVQRTVGSTVRGVKSKRTRNQSTGASSERKLSYFIDDYANKHLLIENVDLEGGRHLDTGNTEKSTNRYNFGHVTKTNPVTFYYDASSSSMSSGDEIYVDSAGGMTEINKRYFTLANTASLLCSITTISNAAQAVVTYTGSDSAMANDRKVYIYGVVGMTEVNGNWYTVKNWNSGAKTFDLYALDGVTPINSSGYGVFVDSTTDKITFGYAELSGVNGTGYGTWTTGGWAFEVSDWKNNGMSFARITGGSRSLVPQGNPNDSHTGQAGNVGHNLYSADNVEYYTGLITPKGSNMRGNGDAIYSMTMKNVVQAMTFDGMQSDHAGFDKNLYVGHEINIENPIWEADQDLFGFEGNSASTTEHKAIIGPVYIRNGAVGRIAKLEPYCGEAVFDNLNVLAHLARVASGTSSRYLFTVNGTGARLVLRNTTLDFRNSSILDSTGAVSTAALKRFGTLVANAEVVLDNVRIMGTSKLDPRYGLFGTDASGTKTIKMRNVYLDDPNFPIAAVAAAAKTISSGTNANPIVFTTSTSHGYGSGDYIYHDNLVQMTSLNRTAHKITVLSATTYSINVDGTAMTAESAGTATCQKITQPTDVTITTMNEDKQGVFDFRDRNLTGYSNTNLIKRQTAVATTDATATTIISIPVAEGEAIMVKASVLMNRSTAAEGAYFNVEAAFRRASGGNVTQISTTGALVSKEDSSGSPSVAFNVNTTSQTLELKVTGEAAKTFYWLANYEYSKLVTSS